MKNILKTIWNVLKYMLIHVGLQIIYFIPVSFIVGIRLGIQGVENFEDQYAEAIAKHIPISLIFAGVGALLIYRWMLNRKGISFSKACRFNKLSLDKIVVSLMAGMSCLYVSAAIISFFSESKVDSHVENMASLEQGGMLLFFITVGIMAPIIEEVIFRGLIFDELRGKVGMFAVIIIQAFLFGLYHLNIVQGTYAFVLGIFLGLSLLWTGSIWAPILIHAGNNILSVGVTILPFGHYFEHGAVMLFALFIVFPFSVWYLYKNRVGTVKFEEESLRG
ncbi:CPBP family intramembrane glutamic endopeptidase [Proteinivorax tanatarense]|uniref:CPBP family intramembrane glutamic endopeptidase n=1 Tax=Proteinivorax tanatarense TaxID=1260629 RepID=A0AAU7VNA3_9FIRM